MPDYHSKVGHRCLQSLSDSIRWVEEPSLPSGRDSELSYRYVDGGVPTVPLLHSECLLSTAVVDPQEHRAENPSRTAKLRSVGSATTTSLLGASHVEPQWGPQSAPCESITLVESKHEPNCSMTSQDATGMATLLTMSHLLTLSPSLSFSLHLSPSPPVSLPFPVSLVSI
jgi:hypothetical protein